MEITEQIRQTLSDIQGIRFSYLFGSSAKDKRGALSDIDVAVYLEKRFNNFDHHLMIHHQIRKALKQEVDLIILNEIRNLYLVESIIKDGIVITDDEKDFRLYYETIMLHRILDYKHFRTIIDAA